MLSLDIALGRGDTAPEPTWRFPFVPSGVWQLVVTTRGMVLTRRSDDGGLLVDEEARTVSWPITAAESVMLPSGRLTTYTLRRIVVGGETRFYAGGVFHMLDGPVPGSPAQVVVTGPQGPSQIIAGTRPPYDDEGRNGQFWIDTGEVPAIYGPKTNGAWPPFGYQLGTLTSRQSLDFSDPANAAFTHR